jgi:hypothetical protein
MNMKNDKDWNNFLEEMEDLIQSAGVVKRKLYVWVLDKGDGTVYRYSIDHLPLSENEETLTFQVKVFLASAGHKQHEIAFMITKEEDAIEGN